MLKTAIERNMSDDNESCTKAGDANTKKNKTNATINRDYTTYNFLQSNLWK